MINKTPDPSPAQVLGTALTTARQPVRRFLFDKANQFLAAEIKKRGGYISRTERRRIAREMSKRLSKQARQEMAQGAAQ